MRKAYLSIIVGISLGIIGCYGIYTLTDETNDDWLGKVAYCDHGAGGNWRGVVGAIKGRYIYLDNAEWQCWFGCDCLEENGYTCDNNSEYKFRERYPLEDEYEKVQVKTDCYIPGDIDSIINYQNRKI